MTLLYIHADRNKPKTFLNDPVAIILLYKVISDERNDE